MLGQGSIGAPSAACHGRYGVRHGRSAGARRALRGDGRRRCGSGWRRLAGTAQSGVARGQYGNGGREQYTVALRLYRTFQLRRRVDTYFRILRCGAHTHAVGIAAVPRNGSRGQCRNSLRSWTCHRHECPHVECRHRALRLHHRAHGGCGSDGGSATIVDLRYTCKQCHAVVSGRCGTRPSAVIDASGSGVESGFHRPVAHRRGKGSALARAGACGRRSSGWGSAAVSCGQYARPVDRQWGIRHTLATLHCGLRLSVASGSRSDTYLRHWVSSMKRVFFQTRRARICIHHRGTP